MKVSLNYSEIMTVLHRATLIMNDKRGLQENQKVVSFFVRDNKLNVVFTDGTLYYTQVMHGTYDLEGADEATTMLSVAVKEVSGLLSSYSSLYRTRVDKVCLESRPYSVTMSVYEVSKWDNTDVNNIFVNMMKNQVHRHTLVKYDTLPNVQRELPNLVMADDSVDISIDPMKEMLGYAYPALAKVKGDTAELSFTEDFAYSVLGGLLGIRLKNTLPKEVFSGITLTTPTLRLMNELISCTCVKAHKELKNMIANFAAQAAGIQNKAASVYTLTFAFDDVLIRFQAEDKSGMTDIALFEDKSVFGVTVDKPYLLDVLKRFDDTEGVCLAVSVENGQGHLKVNSQRGCQEVPVVGIMGNGGSTFAILPSNLNLLAMSHVMNVEDGVLNDASRLTLGFIQTDKSVAVVCKDDTDAWMSKYPRALVREVPRLEL